MTQRLLQIAEAHWVTLDGETAPNGVDLLDLPIDRFLNTIHAFALRGGTPESRRSFEIQLWVPPPGVVPTVGPWSPDAETAAFRGLKQALGSNGTAAPE